MHTGRVVFGAMDEVVFGRPASEAIVEQLNRLGAKRAFLMVSGTLNRETDVIANIRRAMGQRCVGTFDAMPPHTPRTAVIAASEQARTAGADLIVTVASPRPRSPSIVKSVHCSACPTYVIVVS